MLEITYFVHGTTTDNEQDIATGWNPGELSELGIQQSKDLGKLIDPNKFAAIFSSDLKRAVDSAKLTFGDSKIIQDSRLREANYGDWNSQPDSFKNNLTDYIDNPFPNGESYKDVAKRIYNFLEEASQKYHNQHIAIVAHQAPQLALNVITKGITWEQAIATDWRRRKKWQPGWDYIIKDMNPKTFVFDFDGVITQYDGFEGEDLTDEPREEVVKAIRELKKQGHTVIIYSCRGAEGIRQYCAKYYIPVDYVNENPNYLNSNPGKPVGTVYIDDRAHLYAGQDAATLVKELNEFEVYYKK